MKRKSGRRRAGWWLLAGIGVLIAAVALVWLGAGVPRAAAAPREQGVSNDYCLGCHGRPGQTRTLPSGELQYMTIDPDGYAASVHGSGGYACVQCHTTIREYPHPPSTAQDLRDVSLQNYTTCQQCHSGNYEQTLDSVHQEALDAGNRNAAVCTDCHNPHYQTRLTEADSGQIKPEARVSIPQTCARCHSAIFDQYKQSVHGSALLGEAQQPGGNPDVPTCIDCHGVHNLPDPTSAMFRLTSPRICADCHTDAARMEKYGLSTAVLNTYLADFHGTTVTLFEKITPDQQTNKPVCYDCHGIHDIRSVADPQKGLHVKQNLLVTCQKCHPDATPDFPDSWLSHYEPSQEKNPLVYYVNLFYLGFIPAVIGGMLVFVAADASRRLLRRKNGGPSA